MKIKKSNILLNGADDVARVKKIILEDQDGYDTITWEPVVSPCLDHDHSTQLVRGVISREINVLLGKCENVYKRHISYWCDISLPTLLRQMANYLEHSYHIPHKIYHPAWQKKCLTAFNKLNSSNKDRVLNSFRVNIDGKANDTKRKAAFKKLLSSRVVTMGEVLDEINCSTS